MYVLPSIYKPLVAHLGPPHCYSVTTQRNTRRVIATTPFERLLDAVARGNAVKFDQLLRDGSVSEDYIRYLIWAGVDVEDVRRLIKKYIDAIPKPADDNRDALWMAAAYGHVRVVNALLTDSRANPAYHTS